MHINAMPWLLRLMVFLAATVGATSYVYAESSREYYQKYGDLLKEMKTVTNSIQKGGTFPIPKDCNDSAWDRWSVYFSVNATFRDKFRGFMETDSYLENHASDKFQLLQLDELVTSKLLGLTFDLADTSLRLQCYEKAEKYYKYVINSYVGTAFEGYRDKARLGLEEAREGIRHAYINLLLKVLAGLALMAIVFRFRAEIRAALKRVRTRRT